MDRSYPVLPTSNNLLRDCPDESQIRLSHQHKQCVLSYLFALYKRPHADINLIQVLLAKLGLAIGYEATFEDLRPAVERLWLQHFHGHLTEIY